MLETKKYIVKVEIIKEIDAVDEDHAQLKFWQGIEEENTTPENEMSENIQIYLSENEDYPITSVCREDLKENFDIKNIDESTMKKLASKMADAYCDDGFWIDLEIIAEHLGIPKLKK